MPNHCYQKVFISGEKNIIERLFHSVKEGRFLDQVIPMPLEFSSDWYEWHTTNWSTKWDIVDGKILHCTWDEENPFGLQFQDIPKYEFSFTCWTAWSPPYKVWSKLMALGCEVQAQYFDECGNFVGRWIDGIITEWEPSEKPHETSLITEEVYGAADYFEFTEQS